MSNKPSAKAIAKLNASILFPAIRSEIIANPSLFAIRGFFIFNITKKTVPMTEWYLLFQGFDAPAVVSQKRPDVPKAKRDEDPIPVAILQIEDSDLLNFMSGGLTGSRGIVSGRIKIAGAIELAEQLEQIFLKAKGQEKTLAYLEQKRGRSEKARARLSSPTSFSTSPPSSSSVALSEHKPVPAAQSKVHDLARRFSAISKQSIADSNSNSNNLGLPPNQRGRSGSFGRTEGSKVSGLLNKFAEPKSTSVTNAAGVRVATTAKDGKQQMEERQAQAAETTHEHELEREVGEDMEKEIKSNLNVTDVLTDSVLQLDLDLDLVDIPLSNSNVNSNNKDAHVNELDGDELGKGRVAAKEKEEEEEEEEEEEPASNESEIHRDGEETVKAVEQEQ
ncbi:hypothetical protein BGZ95_010049 [Linnemannia exigua]|uniref:SCP2 domain-containing protein n=1 Tax=Linnemannia exigua TaxID=604196 RepID=A0AAD4DBZ9_9FUNG|nr:hypothetical protein BGZ95_010049 [Linnemannia exigua]